MPSRRSRTLPALLGFGLVGLVASGGLVASTGCFVSLGEPNARPDDGGPAEDSTVMRDAASDASADDGGCPTNPDPTLLGFWRFEEPDGDNTVKDCSGKGLDGVLAEGTIRRVPAHSGRGIDIDGVSGCFDLGFAPSLAFTGGSFTVSAWILVRTFSAAGSTSPRWVIGRAGFDVDRFKGWGAGSKQPSAFELKLFPTGTVYASVEGVIPQGKLVHVAAIHSSGNIRVYAGGARIATYDTLTVPDMLPTARAYIGCRNEAEPPFDGVIDELRVYGRALSDGEIADLAK